MTAIPGRRLGRSSRRRSSRCRPSGAGFASRRFRRSATDPFLVQINRSLRTWITIINGDGWPRLVLNASAFLRPVQMNAGPAEPCHFCHEPVVITDPAPAARLGVERDSPSGERPRGDLCFGPVLLWTPEDKQIPTGAHSLGICPGASHNLSQAMRVSPTEVRPCRARNQSIADKTSGRCISQRSKTNLPG